MRVGAVKTNTMAKAERKGVAVSQARNDRSDMRPEFRILILLVLAHFCGEVAREGMSIRKFICYGHSLFTGFLIHYLDTGAVAQ